MLPRAWFLLTGFIALVSWAYLRSPRRSPCAVLGGAILDLWISAQSKAVMDFNVFHGESSTKYVLLEEESRRILGITSVDTSRSIPARDKPARTIFGNGLTLDHSSATIKGKRVKIFHYDNEDYWKRQVRNQEHREKIEHWLTAARRSAFQQVRCLIFRKSGEPEPNALTKAWLNVPSLRKMTEAECANRLRELDFVHLQEVDAAIAEIDATNATLANAKAAVGAT